MTMFEFVIVFLVGGVVILATTHGDRSITNCAMAILTVGLLHNFVAWLKARSSRVGALVDGTPLVLLKDGAWVDEVMRGMKMAPEDIMAAARMKGINSIFDVKYAILERNGTISIIKAKKDIA
ncbi:DUF421 domain-containing protein [Granulicella sp. L60]|uniref:DUF421 domain-containing protein n=1 Tax=Granulicella sp. L60 TaxID=1641866 RepID=UPI0020B142D6|nr:YetF domain-containing protein [Granulicella sp. L60]